MNFDRVVVINLDRRPERLAAFRAQGPLFGDHPPASLSGLFWRAERFTAIDGQKVPKPAWFPFSDGAWGCTQSHLRVYEQALNHCQDVFIFEDDAVFVPDVAERLPQFLDAVPGNWDMVYLGGCHHLSATNPPLPVNEQVLRAKSVGCCTAYGIRYEFLRKVYPLLLEALHSQGQAHVIDHLWWRLQVAHPEWKVFCPSTWLCGQAAGPSDVDGQAHDRPRFWQAPPAPTAKTINFFSTPETIPGWFTPQCGAIYRREALAAIERSGGLAVMAEVGCYLGHSLAYLAEYLLSGQLVAWAVDKWEGTAHPSGHFNPHDAYAGFQQNMRGLQVTGAVHVLRKDSLRAADDLINESLDLVMIDDDHTYDHVAKELPAWWLKVASGGVLMGHDYRPQNGWPDVARAVGEFAERLDLPIEAEADLWIIRKPEDYDLSACEEHSGLAHV